MAAGRKAAAPRLEVDVQYAADGDELPAADAIETWVAAALAGCGAGRGDAAGAQLTVRIVGAAEGTELNERYRHRTGPTNVLSFPFEQPALLQPPLLGDIVLCAPVVAREAAAQGKAPAAHWAHLVVHGVLHLLGHDHEDERQAEEMEALERDILATLGLPDPYAAERAAGDAPARRRDESHKKVRKDR